MKKNLARLLVCSLLGIIVGCQKGNDNPKGNDKINSVSEPESKLKTNGVNPGSFTVIYLENDRYVAHFGFGDIDLGNIYFHSGSFVDGEAVASVGIGVGNGTYVSIPYPRLIGNVSVDYYKDLSKFNTAWDKYLQNKPDTTTHLPYSRPYADDYIHSLYGEMGVFKGIVVRSHSSLSTLIIRSADFVPVAPTAVLPTLLGYIKNPITNELYDVAGYNGNITQVISPNNVRLENFSGSYTGKPEKNNVIINIRVYTGLNTFFDYNGPALL